ncbi:MAG: hypothetical protein EOM12_07450 [Verrucomicrobiae bacterium]|nr:hypothetical protein [Verrucomicrobiae bacterium]
MDIFVSGFGEHDAFSQGYAQGKMATTTWLEPQDFLSRAQQKDFNDSQTWIWLYRGPWSLLQTQMFQSSGDVDAQLQEWASCQRSVLKLKHTKKTFLLVNTDTTSSEALNAHLGLGKDPIPATSQPFSDLTLSFAKLMEWVQPNLWDVFETLEMSSTLPAGEPQSRFNLPLPAADVLQKIAKLLSSNEQLPRQITTIQHKLEQSFLEKEQIEHELRSENETLTASNINLKKEVDSLRVEIKKINIIDDEKSTTKEKLKEISEENNLLFHQLHVVQEELEKYFKKIAILEGDTDNLSKVNEDTKLKNQQLNKKLLIIEQDFKKLSIVHQTIQSENEQLLIQIHTLQEELEKYYLANKGLQKNLEKNSTAMDRARILLNALSAQ